jgi:hypothetical protein
MGKPAMNGCSGESFNETLQQPPVFPRERHSKCSYQPFEFLAVIG